MASALNLVVMRNDNLTNNDNESESMIRALRYHLFNSVFLLSAASSIYLQEKFRSDNFDCICI